MIGMDNCVNLTGRRVLLVDHPWQGHAGRIVRITDSTLYGKVPVVHLDDVPALECFVFRVDQMEFIDTLSHTS